MPLRLAWDRGIVFEGARRLVFLMLATTLCYTVIRQLPIPELFKTVTSFVFGYYFGSKSVENQTNNRAPKETP